MSSGDFLSLIATEPIQHFIREHEKDDERKLVLGRKSVLGVPASVIAEQLQGRRKAKEKLPTWYQAEGIFYPPALNLEQCSSESTAHYKTIIIQKALGKSLVSCADLTGGFGVDVFFFSRICKCVHYVEPDPNLVMVAKHNHEKLGAKNISHHTTLAENFIERSADKFDFIYIDPSRRSKSNKKVFTFSDCEPNVTLLIEQLLEKTNCLLIKASPLIDLLEGQHNLRNVQDIYVVSLNNECKEVLFLCSAGAKNEPGIHAVNLLENSNEEFTFTRAEEKNAEAPLAEPSTYIYEPNASILKAGAFKLVATRFGLSKLHINTHLYTGQKLIEDFPGRVFKINAIVKPEPGQVKAIVLDGKANVITRNYPLAAEALKKKLKLKDGGDKYLIGFTAKENKYTVVADRIK